MQQEIEEKKKVAEAEKQRLETAKRQQLAENFRHRKNQSDKPDHEKMKTQHHRRRQRERWNELRDTDQRAFIQTELARFENYLAKAMFGLKVATVLLSGLMMFIVVAVSLSAYIRTEDPATALAIFAFGTLFTAIVSVLFYLVYWSWLCSKIVLFSIERNTRPAAPWKPSK